MRAPYSETFTVTGLPHHAKRIAVEQQALIVKRLVPFLAVFTALAQKLKTAQAAAPTPPAEGSAEAALTSSESETRVPDADPAILFEILQQFGECCAKMPDADYTFVIYTCLAAVERQIGDRWTPVSRGNHLLFTADEDPTAIDLAGMMEMAGRSFWFNCESFFGVLPSSSREAIRRASARLSG